MLTHVGFDARIQLLQVVYVAAQDLDVLQAVLLACSAPESKDCCAALQPPHMHLHTTQGLGTYPVVRDCGSRHCFCPLPATSHTKESVGSYPRQEPQEQRLCRLSGSHVHQTRQAPQEQAL